MALSACGGPLYLRSMTNHLQPTTSRALAESRFYDRYAERLTLETLDPLQVFAPTCLENVHLLAQLDDLHGKRVLDIGCGQGDTSVFFALRGAEVWSIDVADRMVKLTQQLALRHGVGARVHAEVCRVEELSSTADFFDIIFADGVLHHLDMQQAVPNIRRVMKPGGRGLFLEPLRGSIFSEIYRFFAKDLRTADERPLEERDLQYLTSQFGTLEHREYHLVSLVLFAVRFATLKLTGKAFPYWMDEVRQGKYHPKMLRWLQTLDEWLLGHFRWLRRYCWMTVITVRK